VKRLVGELRRRREAVLRTFHEHSIEDLAEEVVEVIHPRAEMRLLVSYGEPVYGRDAIVQALQTGREALIFQAHVEKFEWLDEQTSLTTAHARYPLASGGFGEGRVYWLDELRDGLVWRVRVFSSEDDALDAFFTQKNGTAHGGKRLQVARATLRRRHHSG